MKIASCVGAIVLTLLIRNTCIQNIRGIKVRFHNLGYCDEEGATPIVPFTPGLQEDDMMDRLMDEQDQMEEGDDGDDMMNMEESEMMMEEEEMMMEQEEMMMEPEEMMMEKEPE